MGSVLRSRSSGTIDSSVVHWITTKNLVRHIHWEDVVCEGALDDESLLFRIEPLFVSFLTTKSC